ncbi:unnamed protein product, partial [Didymodactylos carnosus]
MATNGRYHSTTTNGFNLTLTGTSLSGHKRPNSQQSSRTTTPKQTSRPGSARSNSYLGEGESTKRSVAPHRQRLVHTASVENISATQHRTIEQGKENRSTVVRERHNSGSNRPPWSTQATVGTKDDRTNYNRKRGNELQHPSSSTAFRGAHSPRDSNRSFNPPSTGRTPNISGPDTQNLHRYSEDIDAFFTDDIAPERMRTQTQPQTQKHDDIDSSWDDTKRWVVETNQMKRSQTVSQENHSNNHNFSKSQQQRHPLNLSSRDVGPSTMQDTLMSRDSLNLMQSNYNIRSQQLKASQIAGIAQQTPIELDLKKKVATVIIQRWYRKMNKRRREAEADAKRVLEQKRLERQLSIERTRELEKLALLEQKRDREEKAANIRLLSIKDAQRRREQSKHQQDANLHRPPTPTSSNRSSNSSRIGEKQVDSNNRTPRLNNDRVLSPMPPSKQNNEQQNPTSSNGFAVSGDMSDHQTLNSSVSSSKVTLNDVYETLRKLEQVEQFPIQQDEKTYLSDSTLDADDGSVENNPHPHKPLEPFLSYLEQEIPKTNDLTVEPVRSQKSTSRTQDRPLQPIRTSTTQLMNQLQQNSPTPHSVRFTHSDYTIRQHSDLNEDSGRRTLVSVRNGTDRKLAQSLSMPYTQQTDSHRMYQMSTPHKSLAINPSHTILDEHVNEEKYSPQQRNISISYDHQNMPSDEDNDDYATHTAQDITEKLLKLRMKNEEKQRTIFLLQQRL